MEKEKEQEQEQFLLTDSNGQKRTFCLPEILRLAQKQLEEGDLLADTPALQALLDAYPELTELPPEVEDAIRAGSSPLDAYRAHENRRLQQQLQAMQQREKNRQAPGSQGGDAEEEELDELMAVFNSMFQ